MKKIIIILLITVAAGCSSSSQQNNPQGGQQQSSNLPQGTGGAAVGTGGRSGSNVGGTGGVEIEVPGDIRVEPYRPCAAHPCAQRLPDPETEEDLKYSLPR